MSPTYTMSAHLCKQIYASWRQTRQTSPEPVLATSPPSPSFLHPFTRSPSPPAATKRSIEERRPSSSSSSEDWRRDR
ncbi:Fc.00g102150.m01.CDS01 [Cosmosporella sp. VM-42]